MPTEAPYTIRKESVALERTLADVRIILTIATAVITATMPPESGTNRAWLNGTVTLFVAYSLAMWIVVRYFPKWIRTAAIFSSFIEVILISNIIWASYAPLTPFYLWYVFYVVSVSTRFGLQIAILGLAASVLMYTTVAMSPPRYHIYVPMFLGYTGFLFILAFLFGHMSERQHSYQTRLVVANELAVAMASLSTSREIIRLLVSQTARLVGAEKCWFIPHKSDEENLVFPIAQGVSVSEVNSLVATLSDWSPQNILDKGIVIINNHLRKDPRLPVEISKQCLVKSLAAVPLYVRDVPVGVLYVADKLPRGFSNYDIELFDLIGAQAAPLIENIQLLERLKDTAASEERLRIARDLHDNFLQTLSAIKLYLERCRLLIDKDPDKAITSIERLHEIATQGLADVRSYLSQLRLMGPDPSRFVQAVERSALEASSRGGFAINTEVDVAEDVLTPQLSLTAFQILRELLINVVKHAKATNVWITIKSGENGIDLEVRDDGKGFDLEDGRRASERGHLGLLGIEERVKEMNGEVLMQSAIGEGTNVKVRLPFPENEGQV
ncbi:MAG TPA: GAF domain-containing sensor histidine kinase [Armatimonadota bacterium]|nr:GAF domain-containing sensor histidine kinase [Armatimonadota bacterium]